MRDIETFLEYADRGKLAVGDIKQAVAVAVVSAVK
jgi:hypothetical protein